MRKRKAFTLIELLIVVAIIAILAVIIIINLVSARDKANYAKVKTELKTVSDGIRLGYADGSTIPTANTAWVPASVSNLATFKNSSGTALLPGAPVSPSGWSGFYEFYNSDSADYGVRIMDKAHTTTPIKYCGYLKGNLNTSGVYSACDGS